MINLWPTSGLNCHGIGITGGTTLMFGDGSPASVALGTSGFGNFTEILRCAGSDKLVRITSENLVVGGGKLGTTAVPITRLNVSDTRTFNSGTNNSYFVFRDTVTSGTGSSLSFIIQNSAGTDRFTFDSNGGLTQVGGLSCTTISATSGTFSSNISATIGTFSGALEATGISK